MVMIIIRGAMYPGGPEGSRLAHRLAAKRGGKIQTKISDHDPIVYPVDRSLAGGWRARLLMTRTSRSSRLLTGLSKLALGGIALGAGCFVGFIVLTGKLDGLTTYGVVCVVGIALATALAAGMVAARMPGAATTAVVFELAAFVAGLVLVELFIAIAAPDVGSPQLARASDAAKLQLPFDSRTKSDVVAELRSKGVDALPAISREWPRLPYIRQQLPNELFPLSHASLADIVECNESGTYLRRPIR